jgi:hypothetical protein
MVIAFVSDNWVLPLNWRETLGPRVLALGGPDFERALTMSIAILTNLSDSKIQEIAAFLVQSIAATDGNSNPHSVIPEPRPIYQLYCSKSQVQPGEVSIMQALAVGTLLALLRACRISNEVTVTKLWAEAGKALSTARAFAEWLYIVNSLKGNADALNLLFHRQVRVVAKRNIAKKASKKSKATWEAKLGLEKVKVTQAYEAGKPWASVKDAADKIHDDAVTLAVKYDKIYKWLLAYTKGKPF